MSQSRLDAIETAKDAASCEVTESHGDLLVVNVPVDRLIAGMPPQLSFDVLRIAVPRGR